MKKLKIGIAGCGAIGSSLAEAVVSKFAKRAELSGLYDIDVKKGSELSRKLKKNVTAKSLEELINNSDLVIEAAGAHSSLDIAKKSVSSGRDVMVMSVGGLISGFLELKELAQQKNARVFIPSGAICGIDGLKASAQAKINKVTLTTKKPPKAFSSVQYIKDNKIDLDAIKKETVIFEGNALAAVKSFPQNINVAATLSLAGIGAEKTTVRIVASPEITRNIHEVEIQSEAGSIVTRTENVIHPNNPKTSYLAVLSAIAVLQQILEPVKIGA